MGSFQLSVTSNMATSLALTAILLLNGYKINQLQPLSRCWQGRVSVSQPSKPSYPVLGSSQSPRSARITCYQVSFGLSLRASPLP